MLTTSPLIYLMIYVSDLAASRSFYEDVLGFRVLEEDEDAAKYDAGHVILCLNKAQDYGITLPTPQDRSAYITFLVEDLDGLREALEQRGVVFSPTERYEVGATTDFFDPDGHWLALYEPSAEALTWPSASKVKALMNASTNGTRTPGSSTDGSDALGLDGKELGYLFMFVPDAKEAFTFYHHILGLDNIEGGPCGQGLTEEVDGVIKYDVGGTLLTTHLVDAEDAVKRNLRPDSRKGLAPVFYVQNVQEAVTDLADKGVRFTYGPAASSIGTIAQFEDPGGHTYYLYEPSAEALSWPSGAKIKQILANQAVLQN